MTPQLQIEKVLNEELRDALIRRRLFLGLTQEQVAKAIECHRDTLSRYEIGKREPTLSRLQLWVRYLGCKLEVSIVGVK